MSVTQVPLQPIQKGSMAKLWLGIALLVLIALGAAWYGTGGTVAKYVGNEAFLSANADDDGVIETASGLQYKVLREGEGAHPTDTDTALVKYEGRLRDGTVFDANEQAPLPVNAMIPGFSEALKTMRKGGEYRLWIPPELGYGDVDNGPIPADSVLIFDVTMIDFLPTAQIEAMRQQMMEQQGALPSGE